MSEHQWPRPPCFVCAREIEDAAGARFVLSPDDFEVVHGTGCAGALHAALEEMGLAAEHLWLPAGEVLRALGEPPD